MNLGGNVYFGDWQTGAGTLALANSGTISQTAGNMYIGVGTTGVFNQTGGNFNYAASAETSLGL